MNHKHKYNVILQKLDQVISASDAFENSRGKLLAHLDEVTDSSDLKTKVKEVFDLRKTATDMHKELCTCLQNHHAHFLDKEMADFYQALSLGYKALRDEVISKRSKLT